MRDIVARSDRETQIRNQGLAELLHSRSVRIVLGAVALIQGVSVAERVTAGPETVAVATVQTVPARVGIAPVALAASTPSEETAAVESPAELAERYKGEGFSLSTALAAEIHKAALENEIDPEIAFGLVRAESGFRSAATSPVGAIGLTQLMPRTARWLRPGVTDRELRDPGTNLRIGFGYLKDLIEKYEGNESLALLAYNRGPGTVDRALKRGASPDNGYADFVRGKKDHGHKLFTR